MKILVINPNSDTEMTQAIQKTAEKFASGKFEVLCRMTPGAPGFIETREDEIRAAPGMRDLVRKSEDEYDAFVVACHCDPNLDVLKEMTPKPVVGIGEASMRMACQLGRRFSILQTTEESVPMKEALVRKYRLQGALASVRAPDSLHRKRNDHQKFLAAARAAVEEDGADVIVLGCAGLTGMAERLQEALGIHVLDGVICGLSTAADLLKSPLSKKRMRS